MNANLAGNLVRSAEDQGDLPALRLGATTVSYAELNEQSARVASLLRSRGVGPGDAIGVMLPNVSEFAAVYYGVLRVGAVVVPMNILLKAREVEHYLGDPEAELVFAWHDVCDQAERGAGAVGAACITVEPAAFATTLTAIEPTFEVTDRAGDDTAIILYTSGTTGTPKGAQLTHSNMSRNADVTNSALLELDAADVVLGALPLFHAFGQTCGLNAAIAAGASLALIPRFDPAVVLERIERARVTVFEGVPTMYSALLNHPERANYDVSSLRICVSGGAAMPVEVLHGFEKAFNCTVLEGYGLSETSPVACFNQPHTERVAGSIGTPVEGVEMKIVDMHRNEARSGEPGEVAIRGHNVMKGYLNRPEATAEALDADGWFYTGDIGKVDENGRFYIVDRKKELIIRGGFNVYPREIEEVLYEHPSVREAAVIGLPHPTHGEEVAAAVALKHGAEVSADDLKAYVKSQVAAYKYPRHVWLVDELPKGPTGKILKREIVPPVDLAPPPVAS